MSLTSSSTIEKMYVPIKCPNCIKQDNNVIGMILKMPKLNIKNKNSLFCKSCKMMIPVEEFWKKLFTL